MQGSGCMDTVGRICFLLLLLSRCVWCTQESRILRRMLVGCPGVANNVLYDV